MAEDKKIKKTKKVKEKDLISTVKLTAADKIFYRVLDTYLVLILIAVVVPLWSTITTAFRPMSFVGTNVEHMGETDEHVALVSLRSSIDEKLKTISVAPVVTEGEDVADVVVEEVVVDEETASTVGIVTEILKQENMKKSLSAFASNIKGTQKINKTISALATERAKAEKYGAELSVVRNAIYEQDEIIAVSDGKVKVVAEKNAAKLEKQKKSLEAKQRSSSEKILGYEKIIKSLSTKLNTSSERLFLFLGTEPAINSELFAKMTEETMSIASSIKNETEIDMDILAKLSDDISVARKEMNAYIAMNQDKKNSKNIAKVMNNLSASLESKIVAGETLVELRKNIQGAIDLDASLNIGSGLRGMFLAPWHWSIDAFKSLLGNNGFLMAFRNSFIILFFGVFIALLMTIPMAYTLSVKNMPGLKFLNVFILIPYLFNTGMIPMYLVIVKLGLINHIGSIFVPGAIGAYNVLIMRGFFEGIPEELKESARIDGASEVYVLWRIILPLSKPIIMTIGLYYGVSFWNDFMHAVLYLNDNNLQPLPILLRNILLGISMGENIEVSAFGSAPVEAIKAASVFMSAIPMIVAYPFIQKYFTKGTLVGSVKG